jgi:2,4-dienoyl-CoA reductase-like NADH-dependent reductase (Old Yellow Enzyme family)
MSKLFSPFKLRDVEFRNRVFVSPMCQYTSQDGLPTAWHMVHLGSRAVGGAGLVMVEATAISPEGRISPADSGLWSETHAEAFTKIAKFIFEQGAIPAIQLAHAGRKASTDLPWNGGKPLTAPSSRGWQPIAPSAVPFDQTYATPVEMNAGDLERVREAFAAGARRANAAGFQVVEIHMAHGYLLHEFLSPLTNLRGDDYGGSFENRSRFPLEVANAVRAAWPLEQPLFVRISCTDWVEGGWDLKQSVEFSKRLKEIGVDLIDCSSGGLVPNAQIPMGPNFQVPFAAAIRKEASIATGAVGFITEAWQAEDILTEDQADVVLLAREMLRDPYWPLHAAATLGDDIVWPKQYLRAKPTS